MIRKELNVIATDLNAKAHGISYDGLLNSDMEEHLNLLKRAWNTDNGRQKVEDLAYKMNVLNDQFTSVEYALKQVKGLSVTVSSYKKTVKTSKDN